jgi:hypothetical protein
VRPAQGSPVNIKYYYKLKTRKFLSFFAKFLRNSAKCSGFLVMSPISRIDEIKFVQLKTCCGNAQGVSVYYALRGKCVLAILLRILNIVTGRHNLLRWQNLGEIRSSGAASLTRLATGCSLSPSSRATERIRAHRTQLEIISRAGNGALVCGLRPHCVQCGPTRSTALGEGPIPGAASLARLAPGYPLSPSSRATERIRAHRTQLEIISRAGNGPLIFVLRPHSTAVISLLVRGNNARSCLR